MSDREIGRWPDEEYLTDKNSEPCGGCGKDTLKAYLIDDRCEDCRTWAAECAEAEADTLKTED